MAHDILIVDDEADIRHQIGGLLHDEGFTTREAANTDQALQEIALRQPSLVILDIWLQGSRLDGIQILDQLQREVPSLPVLMISGHGNIETAVTAIKKGAYDFIEKPFKADRILLLIHRALEASKLKRENLELRQRAGIETELIGKSTPLQTVRQTIERAAPTGSRVLISGPPGSGKEVVARMIHARSKRQDSNLVIVNCATMRADSMEAELFGVEGNAAQGTHKAGLLEQAHGGTLVLDEVADMPLETQGKIVRVLQEQNFSRVGGTARIAVDVRIIATSNRDLKMEMETGCFRQDLYYRLNVVPIVMPALSERREDIPALCQYFLQKAAETAGLAQRILGEDALAALQAYAWPGNVRQLKNVMDWLLIMAGGTVEELIRADQLPSEITTEASAVLKWERGGEIMGLPLRDARELFEREYLLAQVTRFGGNISRTAGFIGMERSALHRKLKMLGVHTSDRGAALEHAQ